MASARLVRHSNRKAEGAGFYEITGLAWSGRGNIARVEISLDGGKTWSLATLQDPVLPICQRRFRFPWIWEGQPAVIQSRATTTPATPSRHTSN
jgi:sulfane dehydrogenase subunit SoxC